MTMQAIKILKNEDYVPAQQNLINVFENYLKGALVGIAPIVFTAPYKSKGRKQINHIPCRTIGMDAEGRHLIAMEAYNFVLLMVKSGIKIEVVEEGAEE